MIPSHFTPGSLGFHLRSGSLPGSPIHAPPPALASSLSASAVCTRIGSSSALHLPDSLGVAHGAEFLGPISSVSGRPISGQAPPEPSHPRDGDVVRFFDETTADQVFVPVRDRAEARRGPTFGKPPLHPNRANVTGGFVRAIGGNANGSKAEFTGAIMPPIRANVAGVEEEPNRARDASHFRSRVLSEVFSPTDSYSQTLLSESSYISLLNRVTVLTETQRSLEEAVLDMGSLKIDLDGRVFDVKIKTAETIGAQEQSMAETFKLLFGRIEKVEKKNAHMEAKRATLEAKLVSLNDKNAKLEVELGGKKEKLEKMKKEMEKRRRLLKYGCIGGLVVGAACLLFK